MNPNVLKCVYCIRIVEKNSKSNKEDNCLFDLNIFQIMGYQDQN